MPRDTDGPDALHYAVACALVKARAAGVITKPEHDSAREALRLLHLSAETCARIFNERDAVNRSRVYRGGRHA